MNCPQCGTANPDDAVICASCDNILDASFLEEASAAPALDDEGTDPGAAPALDYADDEGTDPGAAPALATAGAAAVAAAPATAPDPYDPNYAAWAAQQRSRPAPQPPAPQKPAGRPAAAPAKSGGMRAALDIDTSSQMMDDYEKMAGEAWTRFKALAFGEKLLIGGTVVALLSVGMPWEISVSPAGTEVGHPGLAAGGWLSALLAFAVFGLSWYRLMRRAPKPRLVVLAQMAVAGLGILWALVCIATAASGEAPVVNPRHIEPGPTWGVYVNILSWGIAAFGGLVGLKDARPAPGDDAQG